MIFYKQVGGLNSAARRCQSGKDDLVTDEDKFSGCEAWLRASIPLDRRKMTVDSNTYVIKLWDRAATAQEQWTGIARCLIRALLVVSKRKDVERPSTIDFRGEEKEEAKRGLQWRSDETRSIVLHPSP